MIVAPALINTQIVRITLVRATTAEIAKPLISHLLTLEEKRMPAVSILVGRMPAVSILVGRMPIAVVSGDTWPELYEHAFELAFGKEFSANLRKWKYNGKPMWDGLAPIALRRATEEEERAVGQKAGYFTFKWLLRIDYQ